MLLLHKEIRRGDEDCIIRKGKVVYLTFDLFRLAFQSLALPYFATAATCMMGGVIYHL